MSWARSGRLAPPRRAPPAEAARGVIEHVDLVPLDVLHALDDELGDPIAGLYIERLMRIVVDQQHADLVAVPRVDEARRVEARDAVAQREPRTRLHEAGVALRNRNRDTGWDERAAACRREAH